MTYLDLKKQEGVTLLAALLMLSAVTAIVFTIASIVINEVRTSGDVTKSEAAITAAAAGAEQAMFKYVRAVSIDTISTNCNAPSSQTLTNGVIVETCANSYFDNPHSFSVGANSIQTFYLFDPLNPSSSTPGYTNVTITMNTGTDAVVRMCVWEEPDCTNPTMANTTVTVSPGSPFNSGALTNQRYQIFVMNGITTGSFTMVSAPYPVPAGQTTVITAGKNGNVTRKIKTQVPQ